MPGTPASPGQYTSCHAGDAALVTVWENWPMREKSVQTDLSAPFLDAAFAACIRGRRRHVSEREHHASWCTDRKKKGRFPLWFTTTAVPEA
jgi:hypothetical protein